MATPSNAGSRQRAKPWPSCEASAARRAMAGPAANSAVANSSSQGTMPENTFAGVTSSNSAPATPPSAESAISRRKRRAGSARSSGRKPSVLPR
ncbi:hypothetical protein D3C72_2224850 [compost metagenome]